MLPTLILGPLRPLGPCLGYAWLLRQIHQRQGCRPHHEERREASPRITVRGLEGRSSRAGGHRWVWNVLRDAATLRGFERRGRTRGGGDLRDVRKGGRKALISLARVQFCGRRSGEGGRARKSDPLWMLAARTACAAADALPNPSALGIAALERAPIASATMRRLD